jgi:hypothetical protein
VSWGEGGFTGSFIYIKWVFCTLGAGLATSCPQVLVGSPCCWVMWVIPCVCIWVVQHSSMSVSVSASLT